MTRRAVLLTVLGARGSEDEFLGGVAGLHWKLTRFLLIYLGCPMDVRVLDECRAVKGRLDRKLWGEIRKDARKVFGFEGE